MDRFEQELKDAMRREPAPDWLADAVIARVGAERQRKPKPEWFGWARLRWVAASMVLAAVVSGVRFEQQREERIRGEEAKQELMVAFQVTGTKLRQVEQRVLPVMHRGQE
ncbi:MAG TPA: hypothetical protein PKJ41_03715 [Bryobacteraceae bacterium]|nr:hypothetical protein [Bryobacteraceae bacterium]HPT25647.1 hypothetical protein [Bryobacteraceae bacterium]